MLWRWQLNHRPQPQQPQATAKATGHRPQPQGVIIKIGDKEIIRRRLLRAEGLGVSDRTKNRKLLCREARRSNKSKDRVKQKYVCGSMCSHRGERVLKIADVHISTPNFNFQLARTLI